MSAKTLYVPKTIDIAVPGDGGAMVSLLQNEKRVPLALLRERQLGVRMLQDKRVRDVEDIAEQHHCLRFLSKETQGLMRTYEEMADRRARSQALYWLRIDKQMSDFDAAFKKLQQEKQ